MVNGREAEIIALVHKEVKPALGCTEPIAVALAVAKAAEIMRAERIKDADRAGHLCLVCESAHAFIDVEVSGNILKNGMGVGIPGTGMVGLHIAAALGAVCGKSEYGLEVLDGISPDAVGKAVELVNSGRVGIKRADSERKLYVKATMKCGLHNAVAVIEDDHDNITGTWFDDSLKDKKEISGPEADASEAKSILDYNLTVKEIFEFIQTVDEKEISFILKARDLNGALSDEGLKGDYGLGVGKTIASENNTGFFGSELMSYAMARTAAASDARMAGCTLTAMSNSGSGNQGITVTMPVVAYAEKHGVDDISLSRALILSHLIAIHIKGYLGKLSALCGCVIASTGAACGITYLRGGSYENVCAAIKNMIGNITGMVCDGAKVGCALKVASGVSCAVQSAVLALNGKSISEHDGIIEKDIEKTIRNLGRLGSAGMQSTDNMILEIMTCK